MRHIIAGFLLTFIGVTGALAQERWDSSIIFHGEHPGYLPCADRDLRDCLSDIGLEGNALEFHLGFGDFAGEIFALDFTPGRYGPVSSVVIDLPFAPWQQVILVNADATTPQPSHIDLPPGVFWPEAAGSISDRFRSRADQAFLGLFPDAFSWSASLQEFGSLPNGGQRFVLRELIQDGCRACHILGEGYTFLDFDRNGTLIDQGPVGLILDDGLALSRELMADDLDRIAPSRMTIAENLLDADRASEAMSTIEGGFGTVPYLSTLSENMRSLGNLERAGNIDFERYLEIGWLLHQSEPDTTAARTFAAHGLLSAGGIDIALAEAELRRATPDQMAAEILQRFQIARATLSETQTAFLQALARETPGSTALERLQPDLYEAQSTFAAISAEIESGFPDLGTLVFPQSLDAAEAQALLVPGEGLLAFTSLEQVLYAWLVTPDRVTWQRLDVSRAALDETVRLLRAGLDPEAPPAALPPLPHCAFEGFHEEMRLRPFDLCVARQVYDLLLGKFDLTGLTELIVVPDGPLESLPFGVLVTDRDLDGRPRWLIEDLALVTLPTTASLRTFRVGEARGSHPEQLPYLGIAPEDFGNEDPDGTLRDFRLASLPGSVAEVQQLAEKFGAGPEALAVGRIATEANIKREDLSRFRVISFATHGLLAHETEAATRGRLREMALMLHAGDGEDGFLTTSEIAALNLNAEWVLLSACNTAGPEMDGAPGFSGLARAFFFAGVRSLLVTHWLIDDLETPQLMFDTIDILLREPHLTRAASLRQAQVEMLSRQGTEHPFFWAPFVLIGENS